MSNKIGDIIVQPYESLWSLPCKVKYEVHGAYRVPCGGPTEGEEVGRGAKRKTLQTVEPVFWRGRPLKLYTTLVADYAMTAVIDVTPGDGTLLHHCISERIPYHGFCLSELHAKLLKAVAVQKILESMFTSGSKLYDPKLAVLMRTETNPTGVSSSSGGSAEEGGKNGGKSASPLEQFKKSLDEAKAKRAKVEDKESDE